MRLRKKDASSSLFPVNFLLLFAIFFDPSCSQLFMPTFIMFADCYLLLLSRPVSEIIKWFHVTLCLWVIGSVCLQQHYVEDYGVIDRFMGKEYYDRLMMSAVVTGYDKIVHVAYICLASAPHSFLSLQLSLAYMVFPQQIMCSPKPPSPPYFKRILLQ